MFKKIISFLDCFTFAPLSSAKRALIIKAIESN